MCLLLSLPRHSGGSCSTLFLRRYEADLIYLCLWIPNHVQNVFFSFALINCWLISISIRSFTPSSYTLEVRELSKYTVVAFVINVCLLFFLSQEGPLTKFFCWYLEGCSYPSQYGRHGNCWVGAIVETSHLKQLQPSFKKRESKHWNDGTPIID